MNDIIHRWSSATAEIAKRAFDLTSSITTHGTMLGDARESFIRNVLSQILPETVHVGTGQIVDHRGNNSRQVDVVLYRKDFPIMRSLGQFNVYFIEGVLATMEVKSTLTRDKLISALENGKSVRNLQLSLLGPSFYFYASEIYGRDVKEIELSVGEMQSLMSMLLPPHFIFAFKGYMQADLAKLLADIDDWFNHDDSCGESDPSLLPEIIATEGCIGVRNLDNILGLANTKHAFAAKSESNSLGAMLPLIITTLLERIGAPLFGATKITYNLIPYMKIAPSEGNWQGCAEDVLGIHDPRLHYLRRLGA